MVGLTLFITQKVTGSLEVTVTYFMTPKMNYLCGRFNLVYDRGRHGLLYDPKCHFMKR